MPVILKCIYAAVIVMNQTLLIYIEKEIDRFRERTCEDTTRD